MRYIFQKSDRVFFSDFLMPWKTKTLSVTNVVHFSYRVNHMAYFWYNILEFTKL